MKAIRIHSYGSSDLLKVEETPVPKISDNELLIKIFASSVNHIDGLKASGIIRHIYPLQFPWIPGADFAGKIEAIGANVTSFAVGDDVYGSKADGGAYAEYIAVTPDMISAKPGSLTYIEAASVPMVAETALQGLFKYGHLKSGQTVLIHGGAGAVGSYAVQMASRAGARVIVTASGKDRAYLLSLGADEVIDYHSAKFELLTGKVDMVFDLVGGEVQDRSFAVIKESGYLVAVNQPPSMELAEKSKINAIFMHAKPTSESLKQISDLIENKRLNVDVAMVYNMEEANLAWKNIAKNLNGYAGIHNLNNGKKHGKHVIQVRN